jgi:hypothetical protein
MSNQTSITVSLGYTLNLGNFQNLRIDIGCTDFVREGEKASEARDRIYSFCETSLMEKLAEAKEEIHD